MSLAFTLLSGPYLSDYLLWSKLFMFEMFSIFVTSFKQGTVFYVILFLSVTLSRGVQVIGHED